MLLSRVWTHVCQFTSSLQGLTIQDQTQLSAPNFPDFAFSEQWQVLGPFQIGTRGKNGHRNHRVLGPLIICTETPWSSDPLEFHGGFHSLEYDPKATFRSSLAFNGSVYWLNHTAAISDPQVGSSAIKIHVDFFPTIDWPFLQDVYGWAGHLWLGWACGEIYVQSEGTKTLVLDLDNIMEFWIDGTRHFGGDFYSYGRAPVTLHLDPGVHRIELKVVGDVRSAGGIGEPTVDISLQLRESWPGLSLSFPGYDEQVIISDVIGGDFGPLVSPYASVSVRNDAEKDIHVHGFEGMDNTCRIELLSEDPIKLVRGQTRPIGFRIGCIPSYQRRIRLHLKYRIEGEKPERSLFGTTWPTVVDGIDIPHKFTYLHPSGIVSWGVLRPPSVDASCGDSNTSLPVMLALHGANVNANNHLQMHMFDPLPYLCTWILFPQGTTSWSGDDWHNWGLADVEAAINAIPDWIEQTEWKGPGVDVNRWLVSGHSNGGQGVWYAVTHRPDTIIAAAALSGYSTIQNYVPYTSWRTADPRKEAIMQGALSTYRHDLLTDNAKDIPIIIQHGSKDDNVPAYHSRLMDLRIFEDGGSSHYHEMPDEPHFWDGVATTEPLKRFFEKYLGSSNQSEETESPVTLRSFIVTVADPGDMGPKNGVQVLNLQMPGQLGRLIFGFDPLTGSCVFRTSNVADFSVPARYNNCDTLVIYGEPMSPIALSEHTRRFIKRGQRWKMRQEDSVIRYDTPLREGRQLGQMDAILRTRGCFQIVRHSPETAHLALQVSRNLAQYFAADTEIIDSYEEALVASGNIISIAIGEDLADDIYADHPIQLGQEVKVRVDDTDVSYSKLDRRNLAAIFLRPLPDQRLELVVWGLDSASLELAARLVPLMTGSGQPDWVIMDETMLWKGLDGVLALGFFDQYWQVSRNSYFT